jgi:hypothetical protein
MDLNMTHQLLVIYYAFDKYLRKKANTMGQCIIYLLSSVRREVLYTILIDFCIPMTIFCLIQCV